MSKKSLSIAIIGAGLGGLCLAQGLRQQGVIAQVYEKDAGLAARHQGYRLRIDATGQAALAYCLPGALMSQFRQTCAMATAGVRTLNTRLEPIRQGWVADWHDGRRDAQPDLCADRQIMREVLLTGLAGQVHFGKALVRYTEQADHTVAAHFQDGSCVVADLLVGADGINSAVTRQRLPGALLVDTGDVCCYGKTLLDPAARQVIAPILQSGTSVIFESGLAVVIDAMCFAARDAATAALSEVEDYLYWAVIGSRARLAILADDDLRWPEHVLRAHLGRLTQTWSRPLRAMFEDAAPGARTLLAVRSASRLPTWPASRVTVLGDALHAMSPASGLGANCALQDAALLTQAVLAASTGRKRLPDAIADYEEALRRHGFAAVQASLQGSQQLFAATTTNSTQGIHA